MTSATRSFERTSIKSQQPPKPLTNGLFLVDLTLFPQKAETRAYSLKFVEMIYKIIILLTFNIISY